ncbi:MAG: DUF3817 domain-containing protein [Planctomycetota bacterium]
MADPQPIARVCSLSEAVSYLVLLCVAMPLKWVWGMPLAVRVFGMIHGVLWLLLIWFCVRSHFEKGWPKSRVWLLVTAALLPIVPFFLDRRVRGWIAEQRAA